MKNPFKWNRGRKKSSGPAISPNTNHYSPLNNDRPKEHPAEDRLGYRFLAEQIAISICKMSPPDGLVLGLYGAWGSGKTTALAFIKHFVSHYSAENLPVIIDLNVWWFSGLEDLAKCCLNQIADELKDGGKELKLAGDMIKSLASAVEKVPVPIQIGAGVTVNLQDIARQFGERLSREQNIPKIKKQVSQAIAASGRRIVIFVDDIDRLSSEEVRTLFQVIKALGDFENVIYVLAFDRDVVAQALANHQSVTGTDTAGLAYIEKIIQVPFELPSPDKDGLHRMLIEGLNKTFESVDEANFDQNRFANVLYPGILGLINKPRDVVRLSNALQVTYPAVENEVDPTDFIAMEALRVFKPKLYVKIRDNKNYFAGSAGGFGPAKESLEKFHNNWRTTLNEEELEPVTTLLKRLFPKLESVFANRNFSSSYEEGWRIRNLVCSPAKFDIYFRLALPDGAIASNEVEELVLTMNSPSTFADKVLAFSKQKSALGRSRGRKVVQILRDKANKIPADNIEFVIESLFQISDQIEDDETEQSMFAPSLRFTIAMLIRDLANKLEKPDRVEILKKALTFGEALDCCSAFVYLLGLEYGKYNSKDRPIEPTVSVEELSELERIVIANALDAYKHNMGRVVRHQPTLLYFLRLNLDEVEFKSLVEQIIENSTLFVDLIQAYIQDSVVQNAEDSVSHKKRIFSAQNLFEVIPETVLLTKLTQYCSSEMLTESQRESIQFALDWMTKRKDQKYSQND